MNKTELDESLQFLFADNLLLEVIVYAKLKNIEEPMKLDIKADDLPEISTMFRNAINSQILEKSDYTVLPLSTADERNNCIYQYDLELPEELLNLRTVITDDNLETFDFDAMELNEIDSLIIVLACGDNEVSIYKKVSAVEVLGRGGYLLWKARHRLERFNNQLLRISPKFQVIRVNEEVFILDLLAIEKSFGFQDVIKREADLGLNAIEEMHIVEEMESLREMVDDISFARKLTAVTKNSPVLKLHIPNDTIISFSKNHPATKNMKYSENGRKFNLNTKISKKLFLRLLNDDLLTSELTHLFYESLAKDNVKLNDNTE